jgi:hypothetical protein
VIPRRLLPQTVTVKPLTGQGAYGPIYGPVVSVRCRLDHERKLVRSATGSEVVAEATVYARPPSVFGEPGSEVTLPGGQVRTVIGVSEHVGVRDAVLVEVPLA